MKSNSIARRSFFAIGLGILGAALGCSNASGTSQTGELELLNVSYDPTRELWKQLNDAFVPHYEKQTGTKLKINQSHGGSSSQSRLVVDGLEADVVTLALWPDVEDIRRAGLIADDWQQRLPNGSLPYTSTIVFVVRKGNPKQVYDWDDLLKPDVEIITPNPKTSGNGKLSFLAAWGYKTQQGKSEDEAFEFVRQLYERVPVLENGARAATATFAQKGQGDVHLTWENEAHFEVRESGNALEIVYPKSSVLAEPNVSWVDANVERKPGALAASKAYLEFMYTEQGQKIIAENFYRPTDPDAQKTYADRFPKMNLFTVQQIAGNWDNAQAKFFAEGGVFDQVYAKNRGK